MYVYSVWRQSDCICHDKPVDMMTMTMMIYLRALESWQLTQLSPPHDRNKNKEDK